MDRQSQIQAGKRQAPGGQSKQVFHANLLGFAGQSTGDASAQDEIFHFVDVSWYRLQTIRRGFGGKERLTGRGLTPYVRTATLAWVTLAGQAVPDLRVAIDRRL